MELEADAHRLGAATRTLGWNIQRLLATHREKILEWQYQLAHVTDMATELYVTACVLNRLDGMFEAVRKGGNPLKRDLDAARYYLDSAHRRMRADLKSLWGNDDQSTGSLADQLL